jgi:hypothetical protein
MVDSIMFTVCCADRCLENPNQSSTSERDLLCNTIQNAVELYLHNKMQLHISRAVVATRFPAFSGHYNTGLMLLLTLKNSN